jgi:hypothetical protein
MDEFDACIVNRGKCFDAMTRQNLATGWRGVDDEHESFMAKRIFNKHPL